MNYDKPKLKIKQKNVTKNLQANINLIIKNKLDK